MKLKKLLSVAFCVIFIAANLIVPVSADSNEQYIYKFLTKTAGFNTAAASGILANIEKESSFNPTALEGGYTWESGGGYGICQWTNTPRTSSTGRRTRLVTWCTQNGYDYKTLDGQLNYLTYELKAYYPSVYRTLSSVPNTADGAFTAGYAWCHDFEIPAGYNKGVSDVRGNIAKYIYWPKYSGENITRPIGKYKVLANPQLNIRKSATTSSIKLGTVPYNTIVEVTSISNGWGYITYNGITGWISLDYTELVSASEQPTPSGTTAPNVKPLGTYKVYNVTTHLNVRSGPSTSHTAVGKVYGGDVVTVSAISGNWAKITKGSLTGWASMDYLALVQANTTTTTTTTKTTTTTTTKTTTTTTVTQPTVKPYSYGDVNGDSKLTVSDARAILIYVAGSKEFDSNQKSAADVNRDGEITISDARALLVAIAKNDFNF